MEEHGFVIGVYESEESVQTAVTELQKAGFNVKQISVVGKLNESEENAVTGPAETGAIAGASQSQEAPKAKVPDASGSSILMASLNSVGVLKENAQRYEDAVSAGKFLVVAEGSSQDVVKAEQVLREAPRKGAVPQADQAASAASN
jgi:Heat induced stress protein YflT